MVTLNKLLSSTVDRKYGPIEPHEVIDLVRVTRAPETVLRPSMPSVKISTSGLLNMVEQAKKFNLWEDWCTKVSAIELPYNPYLRPEIAGHAFKCNNMHIESYEALLRSTSIPVLVPEDNKSFINLKDKTVSFNNLMFCMPDAMASHLSAGKKVWIYAKNGEVVWYTRAEYEAQTKWKQAEDETKNKISALFELFDALEKAKQIFDAIDQKKSFSALPFKWFTGVKIVMSGLSAGSWGDGEKSNTVTHLVFAENYSGSRLSRDKNQYLCSAGGLFPADEAKKEYKMKVGEVTVDTVPHLVTCKLCLSRIFTHLALTQSNYTDQ